MNLKTCVLVGALLSCAAAFGRNEGRRSRELTRSKEEISDPNYYRLPNDIIPKAYDLRIIPLMEVGNFSFTGTVKIDFYAQNVTKSVTLHTNGLDVTEHILHSADNPDLNIGILNVTNEEERDFHILHLDSELTKGSNYTLNMKFKGVLQDDLDGFYTCSYINGSGATEWMAVTQFEPASARKAFPCFDESRLKATFAVSIARPMNMITLSNMPMKSSTTEGPDLPPGYVLDIYEESPIMSTYLVAFSVSKFIANPPDTGKTFRLWSRENAIDQTNYIVSEAPRVLDVMAAITDINYTLPKMDLLAVPDFAAGAMENWGLLTFRETYLLYENESSTHYDKQMAIMVTAHEMSHQWFGDLVSPEWWSYMWLSEGFATYWMYMVTDVLEPTWRLMEQFVVERVQVPLISDAMEYSKAMHYDVINPKDEDYESMEIAYDKSSSTIRMMEHVLTRDVLFRGLRRYLKERQFSAANEGMLFDAIQAEASGTGALPTNVTVGDIWSSWTTQSGYPVITVNRLYTEGKAVIEQKRFVLEDFDYDKNQRWWIPISFTTEASMDFNQTRPSNWIPRSEATITINNIPADEGWVIFNIQVTGFHRVNYDEQNWGLITAYLKGENYAQIPPVNRAQLLDDAMNLARGGYIAYPLALALSQYLAQETDFIPWDSAYPLYDFLDMQMSESKFYDIFKVYMSNILDAQYKKLHFDESSDDDHVTRVSRLMLLPRACKYDVEDCKLRAQDAFHAWNQTKVNTISANLRDTVYCYGVALGGEEEWNFLWNAFEDTTIAAEKARIIGALGCSVDREILTGYLNKTLENASKIRLQDQAAVFSSVYTRAEGLAVALDFLVTRFSEIEEKCGTATANGIILGISSRITTTEKASQMEEFLRVSVESHVVSEEIAERSQKLIDGNLRWIISYETPVETWLNENYGALHKPPRQ